jgi:hypothetical protein
MTRTVLCLSTLAALLPGQLAAPAAQNPVVVPGLVQWHEDLAHAKAAAVKSRRPVLLFQLLGRLDREFC